MKKQTMIIIIVIAIIAVIAIVGGIIIKNNNSTSNTSVKIESAKDLENMLKSIYSKNKDVLPSLETREIDVKDSELVTSYTGIQDPETIESLVVLEPLMSSQAYSAVALKKRADANISVESLKQQILDNVNMRKWICVSAEKLYITNYNNIIFFVMADEDWASATYNSFKEYVGNNIGKELEKSGKEDIVLPAERPVV